MTLSISDIQQNKELSVFMLNVIMLNVIMLNVITLNVIMLNVAAPSQIAYNIYYKSYSSQDLVQ